jgi:hypothetical protein
MLNFFGLEFEQLVNEYEYNKILQLFSHSTRRTKWHPEKKTSLVTCIKG